MLIRSQDKEVLVEITGRQLIVDSANGIVYVCLVSLDDADDTEPLGEYKNIEDAKKVLESIFMAYYRGFKAFQMPPKGGDNV